MESSSDRQSSEDRVRELEAALDEGSGGQLPPNHPQGWLGERNPDLRRPDDWHPDGSAGLSQEDDFPVVFLAIVLAYLVFFPLAFVMLWRTTAIDARRKVIMGAVGLIGIIGVVVLLLNR
jgi:hypothetical protein